VNLWTGLSISQTSEAIWLYTLRYQSISFDRFFRLWSFPHVVFTHTVCALFAASTPKVQQSQRSGHPYKLPDLWPPNNFDLNPIDHKIWGITQQWVQSTEIQEWMIWFSDCVGWSQRERYSRSLTIVTTGAYAFPYLYSATRGYYKYSLWQNLV